MASKKPKAEEATSGGTTPNVFALRDETKDLEAWAKSRQGTLQQHRLAIGMDNGFRRVWNVVLFILLLFVGTFLPYFVSFYQLRIGGELDSVNVEASFIIIDVFFWGDLVLNFFFTYEDSNGLEIFDLRKIARSYLQGRFLIDLIACMPSQFWGLLLEAAEAKGGVSNGGVYKLTRLARLQRASRLVRMASMSRIIDQFVGKHPTFAWLRGVTGVRIVNFIVTLFWFVHILACGWYLCAALHTEPQETWVNRRQIDTAGTPLLEASPEVQWVNSMYFVLTVFTTVGFGDIGAVTSGEIVYVSFTMLVGAVVHSIIVSEIIGIVTAMDTEQKEVSRRMAIVDDFAYNADLEDDVRENVKGWLNMQAKRGNLVVKFDQELARSIFLDGTMPNDLVHDLPAKVFRGKLLQNHFIRVLSASTRAVPSRLIIHLALAVQRRQCLFEEVIYQTNDHPTAIFIVDQGMFAYVTRNVVSRYSVKIKATGEEPAEEEQPNLPGQVSEAPILNVFSAPASLLRDCAQGVSQTLQGLNMTEGPQQPTTSLGGEWLPYKIFPKGTYFGDVEVLNKKPRRAQARCESEEGVLLILGVNDFNDIMSTFPQFRRVWLSEAARRGRAHARALKKRVVGSLQETAARKIQAFWREVRGRWRKAMELAKADPEAFARRKSNSRLPTDDALEVRKRAESKALDDSRCSSSAVPTSYTSFGYRTAGNGDGEAASLRAEMRSAIAELRTEMLQEIRKGFAQLKSQSDEAGALSPVQYDV